jgi:hypothetical protein
MTNVVMLSVVAPTQTGVILLVVVSPQKAVASILASVFYSVNAALARISSNADIHKLPFRIISSFLYSEMMVFSPF